MSTLDPNVSTADIGVEAMLDCIKNIVFANKNTLDSTNQKLTELEGKINTTEVNVGNLTTKVADHEEATTEKFSVVDERLTEIELSISSLNDFKSRTEKTMILNDLFHKRFNIMFHGFADSNQEESMEERLKNASTILNDYLDIPNANDIVIVDTHRLPQTPITRRASRGPAKPICRPVVIKVSNVEDRKLIYDALKAKYESINDLRGDNEKFYATRHLPKAMGEQRKRLLGKCKKARKEGKKTEWRIDYNTADYCLYIDGVKVATPKAKK